MVKIYDPVTNQELNFYLDPKLIKFLNKHVKQSLQSKDKDYVTIIDGYEGAGKSTFGMQIGKVVDPTLNLDRICMTAHEFKQAIINSKPNQCVIYDEAVTGMSSGDSISRIGKLLKSMMMQMRQKNLFVIIILPSIFELNKYAVLSRARSFFHVYESKGVRGYWVGYNKKDTRDLYLLGKKTYSYLKRSRFNGRFYGKCVIDEEKYKEKKGDALFFVDDEDEEVDKYFQRNSLLYILHKEYKLTYPDIEILLKRYDCPITARTVGDSVRKIKEKREKATKYGLLR